MRVCAMLASIFTCAWQISGESSHLFGDGIAVWIAKERAQPGPIFGNKGQFERWHSVVNSLKENR